LIRGVLAIVLIYPVVAGIILLLGDRQKYELLILLLLVTIVMGILSGVLLFLWFVFYAGPRIRKFRCSLRSVVLFVSSATSVLSLCAAMDGFGLFELYLSLVLSIFSTFGLIWSVIRDRQELGPLKDGHEKPAISREVSAWK
jgi:predicted membrane protein